MAGSNEPGNSTSEPIKAQKNLSRTVGFGGDGASEVGSSKVGGADGIAPEIKVGGCLDPKKHLYIARPADEELSRLLEEREFCRVFGPGQIGKTSLAHRTAQAAAARGKKIVFVDCGDLEETEAAAWFRQLLMYFAAGLGWQSSVTDWWDQSPAETPHQKVLHFLRAEVAEKTDDSVWFFLDGLEHLIAAPFFGDLVSVLRTLYNDRPFIASFHNLVFCLLGTLTDDDFFSTRENRGDDDAIFASSFGTTIRLPDFDPDEHDLEPLVAVLDEDRDIGCAALRRILYWTDGHPYLTMKFARDLGAGMSSAGIVAYVDRVYPSLERLDDDHLLALQFLIEERVRGRLEALQAYREVVEGKAVEKATAGYRLLETVGLIRRSGSRFVVRSRLHGRLFDQHWLHTVSPERRVGPYRIEGDLGEGHSVFRAFDERLDRQVAIKHLSSQVIADANYRQRLRQEVQIVSRLKHPAALRVHDILETEQGEWIVMELVEGRSLREILADEGTLDPSDAAKIGEQIAGVLAEAHESGLLHRDLRAENVMISENGTVKLLNLGLVKQLWYYNKDEVSFSLEGNLLGTGRAMSPEQILGQEVDHRSDLFALGTLLYLLVTGRRPFLGSSLIMTLAEICNEQQTPAAELDSEISLEFSDLIEELLIKDPNQRPSDAGEIGRRLQHIAERLPESSADSLSSVGRRRVETSELDPEASPFRSRSRESGSRFSGSRLPRSRVRARRRKRQIGLAMIATFLLLAGAAWFWRGGASTTQNGPAPDAYGIGSPKIDIAILSFRNLTFREELDWMKPALTHLFVSDLERIEHVRVIPGETVLRYLAENEVPKEILGAQTLKTIGGDLGADFILTGTYLSLGEGEAAKLRLTVLLQDTHTGVSVVAHYETGLQDQLLEIVGRAAETIQTKMIKYVEDNSVRP